MQSPTHTHSASLPPSLPPPPLILFALPAAGACLAFTIVGVEYNDQTGKSKFLIMDPHYCGADSLEAVQGKVCTLEGYRATPCGWRGESDFGQSSYALCMPKRPL